MADTSIRISSDRLVDLNNFKPEDVCLDSIERSLNGINRFTSHYKLKKPLTVAQHSGLVMRISRALYPDDVGCWLYCMIHDFGEAFYGDLSSPLKQHLGEPFREKIKEIDQIILETLWFFPKLPDTETHDRMKRCDNLSLRIEQVALWGGEYDLTGEDLEFVNNNPVQEWFDFLEDADMMLKATYLTAKSRNTNI